MTPLFAAGAPIDLNAVFNVVIIVLIAGAIAYIGDRVGHAVGRRRMSLFGLRPRYTSTISAVLFGVLIALVALTIVSLTVKNARQALFHINQLNSEITALTTDRDRLIQFMKEEPLVFRKDEPLTTPVTVSSSDNPKDIQRELGLFFTEVANYYRALHPEVLPYPSNPLSAPGVQTKLAKLAQVVKGFAPNNAVIVPVAGENVFRGAPMSISFEVYKDTLLYRQGEIIATVEVRNGRNLVSDRGALYNLLNLTVANSISHGMPPVIATGPTTSPVSGERALRALTTLDGPAVVSAVASRDIYAEGPLEWDLSVSPKTQ